MFYLPLKAAGASSWLTIAASGGGGGSRRHSDSRWPVDGRTGSGIDYVHLGSEWSLGSRAVADASAAALRCGGCCCCCCFVRLRPTPWRRPSQAIASGIAPPLPTQPVPVRSAGRHQDSVAMRGTLHYINIVLVFLNLYATVNCEI